ncbi:VC_2705 family sodium/solute symporter [Bauldia sp.]|uniref:VC_2705 family sodium/solute symporter n=1 Tax=Bauldia sp. TaxID=2575872 RepID=UPI003BAADEE7
MRGIGKAYALLTAAFAAFLIVIALVGQFGLADRVIMVLLVLVTLAAYLVIGIVTRTLSVSEFFVAGRSVPPGVNGLATAASFVSAAGLIGLVGAFFTDQTAGFAVAAGWTVGFVLLAVAVAPFYRKSGAVTVADFLAVRYGNPLVRILGVIVLIVVLLPLLAAGVSLASEAIAVALDLPPMSVLIGMAVVTVVGSVFGGMRAVTLIAGAQAIVILFGVLVPAIVFSLEQYGVPIPHITLGNAIGDSSWAAGSPIEALRSRLMPVATLDGFNLFLMMLCLAAGVASLPQVVARSGTVATMSAARYSVAWALLVVGLVAATAPALAVFARLAILNDVVGVEVIDLPGWVFAFTSNGALAICGAAVTDVAAISDACGAAAVVNGLEPGDIAITGDIIALGFADITTLPYFLTALLTAAVLAAALGVAGAAVIGIATSLGHDVYGSLINRRATAGRRLAVSRVGLLAAAVLATWLAAYHTDAILALAFTAPSLAASGFLPAIVLGIWWRRTTFWGAIAGMVAGFGTAAGYIGLLFAETIEPLTIAGVTETGIAPAAAAALGVPVGFAVTAAVSILTPAPSAARLAVLDAIRRPNPDPLLEDHAV